MVSSFITGSHAYGTPNERSDIDICMLVSKSDLEFLWAQKKEGRGTLRFGVLNVFPFSVEDPEQVALFEKWRKATAELAEHRPVTREFAIKFLEEEGACFPPDVQLYNGDESVPAATPVSSESDIPF